MISDESIMTALLKNGSAIAAAADLGINPQTVYRRLSNPEFKQLYKAVKADLLRSVVDDLQAVRNEAVEEMAAIMRDKKNNAAVRLQACQLILSNDIRYSQQLSESEQVADDAYIFSVTCRNAMQKIKEGEQNYEAEEEI